MTAKEIASSLGCSMDYVYKVIVRLKLPRKLKRITRTKYSSTQIFNVDERSNWLI